MACLLEPGVPGVTIKVYPLYVVSDWDMTPNYVGQTLMLRD